MRCAANDKALNGGKTIAPLPYHLEDIYQSMKIVGEHPEEWDLYKDSYKQIPKTEFVQYMIELMIFLEETARIAAMMNDFEKWQWFSSQYSKVKYDFLLCNEDLNEETRRKIRAIID